MGGMVGEQSVMMNAAPLPFFSYAEKMISGHCEELYERKLSGDARES